MMAARQTTVGVALSRLLHGLAPKLADFTPVGGGLPVLVDGGLAGAVGVSGASAAEDANIAAAGIAAIT